MVREKDKKLFSLLEMRFYSDAVSLEARCQVNGGYKRVSRDS